MHHTTRYQWSSSWLPRNTASLILAFLLHLLLLLLSCFSCHSNTSSCSSATRRRSNAQMSFGVCHQPNVSLFQVTVDFEATLFKRHFLKTSNEPQSHRWDCWPARLEEETCHIIIACKLWCGRKNRMVMLLQKGWKERSGSCQTSVICKNLGALVGGRGGSWGDTVEGAGCNPEQNFLFVGKIWKTLEMIIRDLKSVSSILKNYLFCQAKASLEYLVSFLVTSSSATTGS